MTTPTRKATRGGFCPHCGKETGDRFRHMPACARKALRRPTGDSLARSVAHVFPDRRLLDVQRFTDEVTDLDMARVYRAMETGTEIYQGGKSGWTCDENAPVARAQLARTVREGIRTGLLRAVSVPVGPQMRKVYVVPAPVHLMAAQSEVRPSCDPWVTLGVLRYRLLTDRKLVDCQNCLTNAY